METGKNAKPKGLFVTLEGVEGSGKTTQAHLLVEALQRRGVPAVLLREPGGTLLGEAVRSLLLDPSVPVCPRAETLLFLAARAQNVADHIKPGLAAGTIVVCDRFSDSTLAYQGYGRGGDTGTIRSLIHYATGGLQPDLTLLLDVDVKTGLARQQQHNRMEGEPLEFHERVRGGYLELARLEPERITVLDASQSVEMLQRDIESTVMGFLETGVHAPASVHDAVGSAHPTGRNLR
jgi:dTMP kinase